MASFTIFAFAYMRMHAEPDYPAKPIAARIRGPPPLTLGAKATSGYVSVVSVQGTVSLPFEAGDNRKVALKIVDDRGIESLKIIAQEN